MSFGVQFSEEENKQVPDSSKKEIKNANESKTSLELNDEMVLSYINSNRGVEYNSFEDLFKEPEVKEVEKVVEKIINPYEEYLDETDKKYLDFKKDTGRGWDEFNFIQKDFSKKSTLDLAFQKVREANKGTDLDDASIKSYLEQKLRIDIPTEEGEDLDASSKIVLNDYVKPYLKELNELQNKYKTPIENISKTKEDVEMVELENGEKIPKYKYEELTQKRNQYLESLKDGVSSATSIEVSKEFDEEGKTQTLKFNYEFNDEDRNSILSDASDVNNFIATQFNSEKGLDHKGLALFIDKAKNFEKYIGLAMEQARATTIEEFIADSNNENFTRKPFKRSDESKKGYGDFTTGKTSGFGVQI
ncbi:hypothetical protein [Tenacibaculum sp. 190524A02b]|uniref:hypothetical protein n=1 Tax=Tenacibaculum vairaonense TaxID=3137860 RepID=UPI0031FB37A8